MERYDLLTAREKDGRSYFTKVGVMFPNRNGDGFTILFEALPIPTAEGCKVIAKKAEPRDVQGRGQPRTSAGQQIDSDPDFAPF